MAVQLRKYDLLDHPRISCQRLLLAFYPGGLASIEAACCNPGKEGLAFTARLPEALSAVSLHQDAHHSHAAVDFLPTGLFLTPRALDKSRGLDWTGLD